MATTARDTWSLDEDDIVTASMDHVQTHDAFWETAFSRETYFRAGLDYEDYAAAFCAGYVGQVQYGGSFDDAEKSLISNWVRMKGDSRISLDEARAAMRAAWDRSAGVVPAAQAQPSLPWSAYAKRFAVNASSWLDRTIGAAQPATRQVVRR